MSTSRPNDVEEFIRQFKPCGEAARALRKPPSGNPPCANMAEAWERSPNGVWLAWLVERLDLPEKAAVKRARRQRLGSVARRVQAAGPRPSLSALVSAVMSDPSRSKEHRENRRQALREFADEIRKLVKNPFLTKG